MQSIFTLPAGWRDRQLLLGVLLLALTLRCALFVGAAGVDPLDDIHYVNLAHQVNAGKSFTDLLSEHPDPSRARIAIDAFFLRRGAYYPAALGQWLLGPGEFGAALPALLASLATILIVYWIGRTLLDSRSALWGAFVYAIAPVDIAYASRIGVEALQVFWGSCSVALALGAGQNQASRRLAVWMAAGSGVCLYVAHTTRLTAGLFLPILILIALRGRWRWLRLTPILVFFACLALEGLFFSVETGNFWFLFDYERAAQKGVFEQQPEALFYPLPHFVAHFSYLTSVPHQFFKLFFGTVHHFGGLKLFSSLALVGTVALSYSMIRKTARQPILILWVLSIFLFFQYGFVQLAWDGDASTLHYYLPMARPRYLLLLLPGLALLVGQLLRDVRRRRPTLGAALILVLSVPCLLDAARNWRFYRDSLEDMRATSSFLLDRFAATEPVFVDRWGREEIALLSGYQIAPELDEGNPSRGALVVVGGSRGFGLDSEHVAGLYGRTSSRLHLRVEPPPDGWVLVYERTAPNHVARATNLRVYRVGVAPGVE